MTGLLESLDGDPAVDAEVGDHALVRAMLEVEAALIHALADNAIAPRKAAETIARACRSLTVDPADLGSRALSAGNPVAPLVADLVDAVPRSDRAWVHHGATSQDIMDTAVVLVASRAVVHAAGSLDRAVSAAAELAERYRDTLTLARTLGQPALPTTFGARAARWGLTLDHARSNLLSTNGDLPVQLGGAAGTMAALGDNGPPIADSLAERLERPRQSFPWHTDRVAFHRLAGALASATAAAAKVATDVILLSAPEVGEVTESDGADHGVSSTLPHKQNPIASVLVVAAARRAPPLAGTVLAAGVHEQERATGAWHAEWQPLRELIRLTGGAAARIAAVLTGLRVHPARMRANLDAVMPAVMAESVTVALGPVIGRQPAREVVRRIIVDGAGAGPAVEVLLAEPAVAAALADGRLDRAAVEAALDPTGYLGIAGRLVDELVARQFRRRAP